jgi:hypothetical protein
MARHRLTLEKMRAAIKAAKAEGVPIARIEVRSDVLAIFSGKPEAAPPADDAELKAKVIEELFGNEAAASKPKSSRKSR